MNRYRIYWLDSELIDSYPTELELVKEYVERGIVISDIQESSGFYEFEAFHPFLAGSHETAIEYVKQYDFGGKPNILVWTVRCLDDEKFCFSEEDL